VQKLKKCKENMMRAIMVPVANRPECTIALNASFQLAKSLKADVIGVHIRPHRDTSKELTGGNLLTQLFSEGSPWENIDEAAAQSASDDAKSLFTKIAEHHGYPLQSGPASDLSPVANWHEKVGKVHFIMPIIGPASDMLVVSRPNTANNGGKKATAFLTQALLHTQRPVLVLPQAQEQSAYKHVAIAWNRSAEGARALHAAMPVLRAAEKVTFITAGQSTHIGPSANDMIGFLAHHGIAADRVAERQTDSSEKLAQLYHDAGADLLVMGAYSRPRLAEMVFGGATRHMLSDEDIPVLMMHS